MSKNRKFDIVVYGASGFTGKLIAEYLAKEYPSGESGLRWAIAGRNAEKLSEVHTELELPETTPILEADSTDPQSLKVMAAQTKVVLTAAGPYQLYGSELVGACAETGTDYVDLCGEPDWIYKMLPAHSEAAKRSGARIVFSCGFDSVPSDLGVYKLQALARERFGKSVSQVKGRVLKIQGSASGGTIASAQASLLAVKEDPKVGEVLMDPFALTGGYIGPKQPTGHKPTFDEDLNSWVGPFVMATINTKIVHRTNSLLGLRYGEDFLYDEMVAAGPGERGKKIAQGIAKAGGAFIAGGDLPGPGEGPSRDEREAGHYTVLYSGLVSSGSRVSITVSGDQDPGYGSTSKIIAESAVCMALDGVDVSGGLWTPASAMGEKLIDRLTQKRVLEFKTEVVGEPS